MVSLPTVHKYFLHFLLMREIRWTPWWSGSSWDLDEGYLCFGFEVTIRRSGLGLQTDGAYGLSGWKVRLEWGTRLGLQVTKINA